MKKTVSKTMWDATNCFRRFYVMKHKKHRNPAARAYLTCGYTLRIAKEYTNNVLVEVINDGEVVQDDTTLTDKPEEVWDCLCYMLDISVFRDVHFRAQDIPMPDLDD